ncbi:hypothetical protein [Thalassomonas actiniarum]|uniref:Uncharacterized protein n=1 Tax=Thalassomonas actiniarum TaxID=485447 RepID=A0AAE9YRX6_9GAMM|nr:hypothetical protein [Thalassomonas actiniarum]WDD99328.1 hypothetical protein SG35_001155 [Thalassomonas actiniarum]
MTSINSMSSDPGAIHYRQTNVVGVKSVENKNNEFQAVAPVPAIEQQKSSGVPLSQQGVVNLAYQMGPLKELPESVKAGMLTREDAKATLESIEQDRLAYEASGPLKETQALIWVNGEVVAMYDQQGQGASRNFVAGDIKQANGDLNALMDLLKEKYGSDVSIETFAPGTGPTNAEAFELFNGISYSDFINSEIGGRKEALANEQMLGLQRDDAEQKRRILYEQVPQTAVFKVGGSIVGSLNEKGFVDINANILEQADARGIDREALQAFYSYDEMSNTDSDKMQAMLEDIFGGDIEVQQFSGSDMPSLGAVRNDAKAGVLPL